MRTLDLQSETVGPTGNVASEGVLNQLGRPQMDRLTVLVREAVQNSWDARDPGAGSVAFAIDFRRIGSDQAAALSRTVFAQCPPGLPVRARLLEATESGEGLWVIVVADRGTVGLRGPTRADGVGEETEGTDFVDFLRNVGQPPGRIDGGGTYGFGKAAFYLASRVHTVCVYSQCIYRGQLDTRFMAAALGASYTDRQGKHTGRHWWGRLDNGVVEPLHGADACETAAILGLPSWGSELGTSVVVLDPRLDGVTVDVAARRSVQDLLWYFWPKMVAGREAPPAMQFGVTCDGRLLDIPDPERHPVLRGLVESLRAAKGQPASQPDGTALETHSETIQSYRPAATLGQLALVKFSAPPRYPMLGGDGEAELIIPEQLHHVALMRAPELVVKYVEGPPLVSSVVEYGGTFLVDPSVEEAFARSEPPAHDDWLPENLEDDWDRRYVRVAQRRISEVLAEFTAPPAIDPAPQETGHLGSFSDQLGALFLGVGTNGESGSPASEGAGGPARGARSGPPRPAVRVLGQPQLEWREGRRVVAVDFVVTNVPGSEGTLVRAAVSAVLDGGALETDPPLSVGVPSVIGWLAADGTSVRTAALRLGPGRGGRWRVLVAVPPDTMIAVALSAHDVREPA